MFECIYTFKCINIYDDEMKHEILMPFFSVDIKFRILLVFELVDILYIGFRFVILIRNGFRK